MFDQLIDLSVGSIARLLAFFYDLPAVGGSFGVAIILLTLTVMVVLMPLTLRATRSTIKMTQLQPKLRELQKKHKDDKQTLNQEMMALYQAEGVNPVGGCLPMLAQLPVFLILFNVLRGLARHVDDRPYFQVASKAHELSGLTPVSGDGFAPAYLNPSTKMYEDLTDGRTSMDFGPFDLGASASDIFSQSFVSAFPYLVLIAVVVASSYYQQRQISARRGDANEQMTQQQRTQQQLLKILPLMSGAWSFVFPTGLVLYWATSNLFRIGQQAYITRSLYSGDAPGAQMLRDQAAREDAESKEKLGRDSEDGDDDDSDRGSKSANGSAGGAAKKAKARNASSNGSSRSDGRGRDGGKEEDKEEVSVGADTIGDSVVADGAAVSAREKRWAERRAQKAKIQARRAAASGASGSGSGGGAASSRITPKGTKPTSSKKNKRKR
ncbi:MAG: YidC/Oxa1 family membrane protein insertase [Acidimicrobiia bacterium]|nr:YidC/Oxa1 family membrane protein insertase [Acidimicrobiia bacterium]